MRKPLSGNVRPVHDGKSMSSIKRDVKKKAPPRPEAEKIFDLEIQPTAVSVPPDSLERFCSGLVAVSFGASSSVGDYANRVLRLGKRHWYLSGNHSSIGGSWPMAISGYPKGHSV